jgi:hypothetical protein
MSTKLTFPRAIINTRDLSGGSVFETTVVPLHLPCFFTFAEKGIPNVPVLGAYDTQAAKFGGGCFDERSPYFTHQSVFAKKACTYQQVYMIRMLPQDANTGGLVLELTVTPTQVIQYQKDNLGRRITDSNGDFIAKVGPDGTTKIKEAGYTLSWSTRALGADESIKHIVVTPNSDGSTTYPIIAIKAKSPGAYINKYGFALYYTQDFNTSLVNNINAMTYYFEPYYINPASSLQTSVLDIFSSKFQEFSFKAGAYDSDTLTYVELGELIKRYVDPTDTNSIGLEFDMNVYTSNVDEILTNLATVSPEITSAKEMINFVSGVDTTGQEYDHIVVDNASSEIVNDEVVNYSVGGSDGTLTEASYESLVEQYITGNVYPGFVNKQRYPFTHFYDSGFSINAKKALIAVLALRDTAVVSLSTQDVALVDNSEANDVSIGTALASQIALYPESTLEGTTACRADIYSQVGDLATPTPWKKRIPYTYHRLITRCMYEGATQIKGEPKTRPNSEVTAIVNSNWVPDTDTQNQLSWGNGINSVQYADLDTKYYPDLRSVYTNETSLLSSSCFVDRMVYVKRFVYQAFTEFAGDDTNPTAQFKKIQDRIDGLCNKALNGYARTVTSVYQTASDMQEGYTYSVDVTVYGNVPDRVWKTTLIIRRDQVSSTNSTTTKTPGG